MKLAELRNQRILNIAEIMQRSGLSTPFVSVVAWLSLHYDGLMELMVLWNEKETQEERDNIVKDIQDLIKDIIKP